MASFSRTPFELSNIRIADNEFANDAIIDAAFTGMQRNDDRSLVQFYFTSMFLDDVEFKSNIVRLMNGAQTHLQVIVPRIDITTINGYANVEKTTGLSVLGLSAIKFRIADPGANLGSGLTPEQTMFDSQFIFKNEIELGLKKEIVELPTEIMGGLNDVNGFNFKDIFKQFELTSEIFEMPVDNYVRLNYFSLSRTNNTIYTSVRILTKDDVIIRELSGSAIMTVDIIDYSEVIQDVTIDGFRLRWKADFSAIDVNTTLSGLTKEQAAFKIPAVNTPRHGNLFDSRYNTLGNTVNKLGFDVSRFFEKIRLIPNEKQFLISNGLPKTFRVRKVAVSPTDYTVDLAVNGVGATATVSRNLITGVQDVEFIFPFFKAIIRANWNALADYQFYYGVGDDATLNEEVVIQWFFDASLSENPYGLTENDRYMFGSSTEKVLPYLYKSVDWQQTTKIARTNFISLTDNNDEPNSLSKVMSWVESDSAIKLAIKCALMQGDFVTSYGITSLQNFADIIDVAFAAIPSDLPILWIPGNHCLGLDSLSSFSLAPTANNLRTLLFDRFYDRLPQDYKNAFVTGDATDAMYYYCDVPDTNVRVIGLNQFEYPLVEGLGRPLKYSGTGIYSNGSVVAGFNTYFTEAQFNFLINALLTTPANGSVIIMTHIDIMSHTDNNGELNALGNSNIALRAVLASYRNRTAVEIVVDAIDELPSFTLNTDFTGRSSSGALHIKGHIHNYRHDVIKDAGDLNSIQCMAIGNTSPYVGIDGDSVSNYGADILSLDEERDELYVVRYGSRRTVAATGKAIGQEEHGFNFLRRPLKLK